jgi:hypothetical protein
MNRQRREGVRHAVDELALRAELEPLLREKGVAAALAVLAAAMPLLRAVGVVEAVAAISALANRGLAAADRKTFRARLLAEHRRRKCDGNPRDSATKTARKFAVDPFNEIEVESLANKIRRWDREDQEKRTNARLKAAG